MAGTVNALQEEGRGKGFFKAMYQEMQHSTLQLLEAALQGLQTLEDRLCRGASEIGRLLPAEYVWIICQDAPESEFRVFVRGDELEYAATFRGGNSPLTAEINALASMEAFTGQPLSPSSAPVASFLSHAVAVTAGTLYTLSLPLHQAGQQRSVLGVTRDTRFTGEDSTLFLELVTQLGQLCCREDTVAAICSPGPPGLRAPLLNESYKKIFFGAGIGLLRLDISALNRVCEKLHDTELSDLDEYVEAERSLRSRFIELVRVIMVNTAALTMYEAKDSKELQRHLAITLNEPGNDFGRQAIDALLAGRQQFSVERKVKTVSGHAKWFVVTSTLLPGDKQDEVLVALTDITTTKKLSLVQAESLNRYRLLLETANDAIVIADNQTGKIYEINRRAVDLFGRPEEELLGIRLEDLITCDELESFRRHYQQKVGGKGTGQLDTFVVHGTTGRKVPVSIGISVTADSDQESVQVSFHDMSNHYRLEERRHLLATAVDQSAESVVITDPDGNIVYVNPAFEEITGYDFSEVIGKNPNILNSGHSRALRFNHLWKEISSGRVWRGNFTNRKKDGTLFEEEATITPVRGHDGRLRHFVAVKRDITQQKQLEEQVRQSQKMQAIGTLAGGVAHDFNNILTAILGYAELSLIRAGEDTQLSANLQEIIVASERASKLIKQILTFSRQSDKSVSALQLGLIIKEVLNLLRASLPANIEIRHQLAPDVMVEADPTQIHQVILNLCTNAHQALAERKRGCIRVGLDEVVLDADSSTTISTLGPGRYARIQVEDNGCGMAPDFLPRIFEPYFTTRAKQEGTGLGLSVVHGIVNDHRGAIHVESAQGEGSCFSVYLPVAVESAAVEDHNPVEIPFGTGRILVVDDELPITEYMTQVLQSAGYEVEAFTSSKEALTAFKNSRESPELLITDMGMPGLTGLELATKIHRYAPEVPVIICTGFSEEVTQDNYNEKGINGFLPKPFTADNLIQEVHRVLTATALYSG
ncbi:MAG: hypothetical protein CSA34_02455 [Desulfobulbus propionicus]|nr:MAG: hypothetical protein CSA34_02455 [Desulfobulbus propionicus]